MNVVKVAFSELFNSFCSAIIKVKNKLSKVNTYMVFFRNVFFIWFVPALIGVPALIITRDINCWGYSIILLFFSWIAYRNLLIVVVVKSILIFIIANILMFLCLVFFCSLYNTICVSVLIASIIYILCIIGYLT